jgi:glycosyltransferase involved in cell wall biosynthesis
MTTARPAADHVERRARVRRVLHVIPAIAARYGGPSAAVLGMCRALQEADVEVQIASTDADGAGRLNVPLNTVQRFEGIDTIFFRRQLSESFKWSTPLAAWLDRYVRDFDVVHVHAVFSHSAIAAGRACRRAGVPYLVRPLGTLDPWSVRRRAWRKRALLMCGGRKLLGGAALIHYTSAEEQRLAETTTPGLAPGVVVPLGIDDACFASTRREERDAPYALTLSRLDPKKRIDLVIEAWHAMSTGAAAAHWRLVIAGDGEADYVARLRALAAGGPAAQSIEFRGWVQDQAKRDLLERAGAFVLPSYQENFGIAMVEAMAAGVPVIASRGVNLAAEIDAAGAGWLAGDTPAALALTLAAVARDPEERARRGSAARHFAERFRWAVVSRELIATYDRIVPSVASFSPVATEHVPAAIRPGRA